MNELAINVAVGVGSSLLSSGMVSAVVGVYLQRRLGKYDKLEETVTALKDNKVAGLDANHAALAQKVEAHITADRSQEVLTEIRHLSGTVTKNETLAYARGEQTTKALTEIEKGISSIQANRNGDRSYIENVDKALQAHKRESHRNA